MFSIKLILVYRTIKINTAVACTVQDLRNLCYPTSGTRGRSSLRTMERGVLFVPVARISTRQARAFSVVGPSVWNGLPLALRLLPRVQSDAFYSSLTTALFSRARVGSASE